MGHTQEQLSISVQAIFAEVDLVPVGPMAWRQQIPWETPGVYILALSPDPEASSGLVQPSDLPLEIGARWLHDQPIIYIGKAGGLGTKATLKKDSANSTAIDGVNDRPIMAAKMSTSCTVRFGYLLLPHSNRDRRKRK